MERVPSPESLTPIGAVAKIRSHLPGLSGAERAVADWVLDNQAEAARISMDRLAHVCKVSDTTVLRMSRAVGFAGFTDLKIALVGDLVRVGQSLSDMPGCGDRVAKLVRSVFQNSQQTLRDTLDVLDFTALEEAVDALAQASTVILVGLGGSSIVIQLLYQQLFRLGRSAHAPLDVHLQALQVANVGPGDVVFAVSNSGLTPDIVQMLTRAGARGATTVAVTGNPRSVAARTCDLMLASVSSDSNNPLSSRTAQLAVVEAISTVYAAKYPREKDRRWT